jgi:hypothetical protein
MDKEFISWLLVLLTPSLSRFQRDKEIGNHMLNLPFSQCWFLLHVLDKFIDDIYDYT